MVLLEKILGNLIRACYGILGSYVFAIILFTVLTKVILFPISLWTHRNSLKMVALMPELNALKIKYYGDKDSIAEETQKLYKQRAYHPLASTIPLIIQIFLLVGVTGAIRSLLGDSDSILTILPIEAGGVTLLMPLAAGLAALVLTLAQNKISPLQREQVKAEKLITSTISVSISLFLGAFVSVGTGIYWIASNLLTIVQQIVLNIVMPPQKYVDYDALGKSQKELASIDSLSLRISKKDKRREKEDYKRFFSIVNKHLVFYSEKSGFYKYFQNMIEYLLKHSNIAIHYVTNDPKDQIFELAKKQSRIKPYYIGQKKIIPLMMKMDADMVVMTTPGIENYYIKRSYVKKDIEYIYMFHGITSTTMAAPKASYDHYDTIFCVGQHHINELREAEKIYKTKEKVLIPYGYGLFDNLISEYEKMGTSENPIPRILIAPSWQKDNIMDLCIDVLLAQLINGKYDLIVRPHPEYIKRYPEKIHAFLEKYQGEMGEHFRVETDFSSNSTVFTSDIVISDWSGVSYEFSFTTLRPSLFIDTPMKVLNPEYTKFEEQPTDIKWRNEIGVSISTKEVEHIEDTIKRLLLEKDAFREKIALLRKDAIFNIRRSGEVGGKYILKQLIDKKSFR